MSADLLECNAALTLSNGTLTEMVTGLSERVATLREGNRELLRQRDEWKDASRETQRVLDVRLAHLDEARAQRDALLEACRGALDAFERYGWELSPGDLTYMRLTAANDAAASDGGQS